MYLQTIPYKNSIINYVYDDKVTMKASAQFLLLAKSLIDSLHNLYGPDVKLIAIFSNTTNMVHS